MTWEVRRLSSERIARLLAHLANAETPDGIDAYEALDYERARRRKGGTWPAWLDV